MTIKLIFPVEKLAASCGHGHTMNKDQNLDPRPLKFLSMTYLPITRDTRFLQNHME